MSTDPKEAQPPASGAAPAVHQKGVKVFTYPKGTYTPVISDGHDLYLTGYSSITALEPVRPVRPGIGEGFVAPNPVRPHPGAAAAGAARRAHRRGKARREAGR